MICTIPIPHFFTHCLSTVFGFVSLHFWPFPSLIFSEFQNCGLFNCIFSHFRIVNFKIHGKCFYTLWTDAGAPSIPIINFLWPNTILTFCGLILYCRATLSHVGWRVYFLVFHIKYYFTISKTCLQLVASFSR